MDTDKQTRTGYEKVLADLEAQKKVIDNGIAAMRALLGAALVPTPGTASGIPNAHAHAHHADNHTEIKHDTFFSLSVVDAAKKYLEMVKATKSSQEIADALEKGGMKHRSKHFKSTVDSLIKRRAKDKVDFVKVSRGQWGLISWYGHKTANKD